MGRTAKSAQGARAATRAAQLAKARQRRQEMDKDREARDERIVVAVADVYERQDERDEAARALELAEVRMGEAISRILAEGVPIAQVAGLTELSPGQVQKLRAAAGQTDAAVAADGAPGLVAAPGPPRAHGEVAPGPVPRRVGAAS